LTGKNFGPIILTIMRTFTGHTLLLLLAAVPLLAEPFTIDVTPARTRLVTRRDVALYCRSTKEIEGCTEFLGETLACACSRHADGFALTARAQLVPFVYVTRPSLTAHELLHMDDLRAQLAAYLADLTSRSYDDAESCRAAAEFEAAVFPLRMDLFRRISNERLH
jgi:hypothetical protein